ncbi:hypothetical protein L218DRAFT_846781, partial [Marasmius fiardii PR-910]
ERKKIKANDQARGKMTITLYDLEPSYAFGTLGASPFVRAIILALNYKKIPYDTVHIGFSDVEPTAKRIGAPPTGKKPNG